MNSPDTKTTTTRNCHCKGCVKEGTYRAPQSPKELDVILWFCLEHIREHNARWNYLDSATPQEIEKTIRQATVWERPTWPFSKGPLAAKRTQRTGPPVPPALPEKVRKALHFLALREPVSWEAIKARYRALAKRYHPDTNGSGSSDIAKFHAVQEAFGTLKNYYAKKRTGA